MEAAPSSRGALHPLPVPARIHCMSVAHLPSAHSHAARHSQPAYMIALAVRICQGVL